jgi:hypothetical protein
MPHKTALLAFAVLVAGAGNGAAAQESTADRGGAAAEIRGRLRSFYFNLAHNDWEALTADILAAKVVAHRPRPESLLVEGESPPQPGLSARGARCSGSESVSIEQAVITLEDEWAAVTVPLCAPVVGHDEFRLIRFDGRWRFVSVHLFQQPLNVTVER